MTSVRLMDRYVIGTWLRLFILTALGFPFVAVLIAFPDGVFVSRRGAL